MSAFVLGLALASAGPSVPAQWLSDDRPKSIRRIVTVAPALTELLFALDAGDLVVGVTRFDDYPPEVKKLPKVGGFLDPNVEAIAVLKPDLVLANPSAGNRKLLERVAAMKIPVYVVPGNTFDDIYVAIDAVGGVLGGAYEKRAGALANDIRATVAEVQKKSANKPKPKALVVYSWNPLIVAGPGSFADTLVNIAGGDNIVKAGREYPSYSVEYVLEQRPAVLIDATESNIEAPPWKKWTSVPAVADGRVHRVTMGGFMRPGPRIMVGIRKMHEFLHPNR